jgi:hypothetical protein
VYIVLIIHHFHFFSCLISHLSLSFHDRPTDGQTNRPTDRQVDVYIVLIIHHFYFFSHVILLSLHTHSPLYAAACTPPASFRSTSSCTPLLRPTLTLTIFSLPTASPSSLPSLASSSSAGSCRLRRSMRIE